MALSYVKGYEGETDDAKRWKQEWIKKMETKLLLNAKFQQLFKINIFNFLRFWTTNSKEISLDYKLLMI